MSYEEIVARNIRLLIEQNNVEQKELSAALGITPQSLSNYLSGTRKFPIGLIPVVADYFGVTIDHLYGRSDER
ncbi:helix-turn-helix transcriptional regulator [Paenibacillus sp. ACRRY]|uniref:helix-turn-helix domain-containing protein n=1 Tax=Paenibacillus sp. ACRRY TaxID=2918208 RepID=UPI001EF5C13A|nr:helix-turn-helix transcriptional regulator [Paenibacillus sp. ACRRY]MCG7383345.1 helix-turn-helix domain-containing protein [Paenibacillus sp. ACRRY]